MRACLGTVWLGVLVLAACGSNGVVTEVGSHKTSLTVLNGQNLNGQNLNGQNLNGQNLNGQNLNGQNLNGPSLGNILQSVDMWGATVDCGSSVNNLVLNATHFISTVDGADKSHEAFVGVHFNGTAADGSYVALMIASVSPAPEPNADLLTYEVQYEGPDGEWYPLCRDANGDAINAIPVSGLWDYDQGIAGGGNFAQSSSQFTFACENAAIAKCILWGYRPWAKVGSTRLRPYHQACTRMVRGDFCGDGTPHTVDGNAINLYDALGLQTSTENWVVEAKWGPNGATCFNAYNRSTQPVTCPSTATPPACTPSANPFADGSLLVNQIP